ncbi:MAG: hypothetical protein LCH95_12495 [Proteobacteria bacterium]|nr:hypothetical protein [Pseudomonadota bacterium]
MTSVIDRPPAASDLERARQMDEAWRTFRVEMASAVAAALAPGKSPPQVAYAIGETVHNYFRTRGLTLTSYELRRRVAELLAGAPAASAPVPAPAPAPAPQPEPAPVSAPREAAPVEPEAPAEPLAEMPPLVTFAQDPATRTSRWTGGEPPPARPVEPLAPPPESPLVTLLPRAPDDDLVARIGRAVRQRLGRAPSAVPRSAVRQAIAACLDALALPAARRPAVARRVLSDLCGLGPLDALWADRTVRSVLVTGPDSVQVERAAGLAPAAEGFRDRAHLDEIVDRLAGHSPAPALTIDLRDGGEAVVLRPPVAPDGPVVVLRRAEPGEATLERLVAAGRLARPMADLLRLAARSRLVVALAGPPGAGKTALLAALARDCGEARLVTLARHRAFRWPSARKIELFLPDGQSVAPVLAAAERLGTDLLAIDLDRAADAAVLARHLEDGLAGVIAAGEPAAIAALPRGRIDLLVRLERRDGGFVVAGMEDAAGAALFTANGDGGFVRGNATPSFAPAIERAGFADALGRALR